MRPLATAALALTVLASPPTLAAEPGAPFQDCTACPEMVVVPAGSFRMGSDAGRADEGPAHTVTIERHFAMGRFEVTLAQWDACHAAGACRALDDGGWGRGSRPAVGVTWRDAGAYVAWLSAVTGVTYRLPTEAEWEYAARAGTETTYWWGDAIGHGRANCDDCESRWDEEMTAPTGSFDANPFGLFDVHGNVWEWTSDCYRADAYRTTGARPADPAAADCPRVMRGGSWHTYPNLLRASRRYSADPDTVYADVGLRVARDIP